MAGHARGHARARGPASDEELERLVEWLTESGERIRTNDPLSCLLCGTLLAAASVLAAGSPLASYTATSANVSGAPDAIRIDILRWSTDAERDKLMDAWKLKTANTGRGGEGVAAEAARPRRSRGPGRRGEADCAPKPTPEAMLATALQQATTVGYLWSREVAGYAIRYAGKIANADGSERIVLITHAGSAP